MAAKVTVGLRVDPDSIEPYKKIYGSLTEGQKIVYATWLPLRMVASKLLKNKFSVLEVCFLITITGKINYDPKDLVSKEFFLYMLSGSPRLLEGAGNEEIIEKVLTKVKDLHKLETFFLFEYCYAFKFSKESIEEYARKIGDNN